MVPKWLERVFLALGVCIIVIAGFILAIKIYASFSSPSGEVYKWSIGIFVLLLVSIISISVAFSHIRSQENKEEAKNDVQSPAQTSARSL